MTDKTPAAPDQLAAIFPEPVVITEGEISVTIPVLTIRQLGAIGAIVRPIFASLPDDEPSELMSVFMDNFEAGIRVLSIATGKPDDWIGAMPPALFGKCLQALIAKNLDYFRQSVLPLIAGIMAGASPGASTDGQTSSTS